MRSDRRRDLVRILRKGDARSQQEIVSALRAAGHDVTQATVSRDLRAVGATKVVAGDGSIYRLADDARRLPPGDLVLRALARTLADFALEITPASSMVVVTTAPGHAAAVARAIDMAGLEEVIGTVAGDDTIFVATRSSVIAEELAARWRSKQQTNGEVVR